jgi:hypothetical protein
MRVAAIHPDILVRNSEDQPVAVIELKNRLNLSREIAKDIHEQMTTYGLTIQAPYFLLLSQDNGFIWSERGMAKGGADPTFEFPMDSVITRYLSDKDLNTRLRESELELLVLQWLNDLTNHRVQAVAEPESTLAVSGLLEVLRGATVILEPHL